MRRVLSKNTVAKLRSYCSFVLIFTIVFADAFVLLEQGFLRAKEALAVTGDFSVFREVTGGEVVTSSGFDVTWDTAVSESSNIALNANTTDINLSDGGKYFVTYNVFTEEGTTGGTNRRSVASYLTLDGTPLAYGRGSGFIRDAESDTSAYNSGAAIIDASSNQNLRVVTKREDANPTAGTAIRGNTNGVSVLKLDDSLEYLRIRKSTRSADISANTTFTDVTWDTADEVDTGKFAFTPTSGDITLKGSANQLFLVTANVKLNVDAGSGPRQNYEMRLTIDGTEIPGTRTTAYLRFDDGTIDGTMQYVGIVKKTSASDQTFNIEVRNEGTASASTDIVGDQTALSMVALPAGTKAMSLSNSTNQPLTSAQSVMNWNQEYISAPTYFTHSTTTLTDNIEIATDGNYLFFASTYTSRTAGTGRDIPRLDWRINSVVQNMGGHGSFNRGSQGGEDTFTSGAASSVLFPNMTTGQVIELIQSDESTGTPVADFEASRVGLQAVEISTLIPAASTKVTFVADQVSTTSPSSTAVHLGGTYSIVENDDTRNVTNITFAESGSIAADSNLSNVKLFYELDTSLPYNCASESYAGTENQFGSTGSFSGPNGSITFTDSVTITTTQTACVYVVADVGPLAVNGDTINISIDSPSTDVVVTSGGTVNPPGTIGNSSITTVEDAEITQTGYHWREDDGIESTASSATGGIENSPGLGFDTSTAQRLRLGIAGVGTGTASKQYRLEYAEKVTSCSEASGWTDVFGGTDWDVYDSVFLVEGTDTTNIAVSSGGVSDGTGSFVTPNGGVHDTSSLNGSLSITADDFTELEYSIKATASATEGIAYCFRVTDNGTPLRNYSQYAEATLSADVTVAANGTQATTVASNSSDNYSGGGFSVTDNSGSRNITSITLTESGTVDSNKLTSVKLFYELDTSSPYNCVSESYAGTENQYGSTMSNFSAVTDTVTFTDSISINTTSALCVYPVYSVSNTAVNGQTIELSIYNPSLDVTASTGSVGPGSAVEIGGTTNINAPSLSQVNYHWRNDDGDEAGATSATAGVENTPITGVFQNTTKRLRVAVTNNGNLTASNTGLRLEYGTKITTCQNIGSWQRVSGSPAFAMASTSQLVQGNNTTNIATGIGGVSNPNTTFISPNSAQLETVDQLASTSITTSEYVEIEYALRATNASAFSATYCFRVTDTGVAMPTYTQYPEMNIQDRQDFYVQRGVQTVSGTGVTLVAGTDYIAPSSNSSAYVRITDTSMTGAGSITLGSNRNPDSVFAYIEGGNNLTTSFSITRPATASDNTRVTWEIIEYIGIPGGDNEMIVRSASTVTYGTSALFATGTAAVGVTNDSDIAVLISGQYNPATNVNNYNTALSISKWNATTDQPVFERGDADGEAARVSYAVVEFTGANWKVQRAEHTFTAAGVTETESITAVNSLQRTFIQAQKLTGDELYNLDEGGHEVWLSSIGAVSFQLENGSTNPGQQRSVAWIIENTQLGDGSMGVYRSNGQISSTSTQPTSYVYSIGATVVPENASIWASNRSSGTGSAHPRAILGARIINSTQFELWKSDEGQNQNFRVEIVDWPVAETSIRQTHYRFYVDNEALTPTDAWPVGGGSDLGENTAITDADEPLGQGERVRIRTGLYINNASLVAGSVNFKLQYARRIVTCSAVAVWDDVGTSAGGEVWRGYDGTPVDGTELDGGNLLISVSNVAGTYEENNPSAVNPNVVDIGEYVEYDWLVENNGAVQKSSYCFRMVENDGSVLNGYDVYPTVRTSGYTPIINNWRWYDDENNLTPTSPLAGEKVAPSSIPNGEVVKLRVSVTEVEGAPGTDIKFNLEYSEYPDFRDGVLLTSTSSCSGNSLWCYADGAGDNNNIIDTAILSGVASCASGVGIGCGTVNEAEGLSGTYDQPALSTSEHEFTLAHAGARVNATYYFRLVDATNGVNLVASDTFPSLTTEGAVLTFVVSGIDNGTSLEGIVTDATTTATDIAFDSLPIDTEVETAQRLTIFTNGTEGYRVFMELDNELIDSYGNTITSVASTNATPDTWESGCTGINTGCFGYHAGDDTLYGGSLRFALDNSYAGVESGPVGIMASNVPVTYDVSEVIFKTEVGFLQPAGDYTTTVTYTAVPIF